MIRTFAPLLGMLAALACSGDSGGRGEQAMCVPGQAYVCNCADGSPGAASCSLAGEPGVCICASSTDATSAGEPTSTSAGSNATTDEGCTTECTDATSPASSSGDDPCGQIYAGKVDAVAVPWSFSGQSGLAAGNAMCGNIGADHVCDYAEVLDAEADDELDGLTNITAWVHRTTVELVDGVPSAPGPGGRCVDWTNATGTLADGEWIEFGAAVRVHRLDPDTFYDGVDSSHTDPLLFPCGSPRAVLCCNPAC